MNAIVSGQLFGRLTAIRAGARKYHWLCKCDCGVEREYSAGNLKSSASTSCGCKRAERNNHTTHGKSGSLTHKRWISMRKRCMDKNASNYPKYGGAGIRVCDEWAHSFDTFLRDMGECPGPEFTLDRKNNALGYSPSNCRWATRTEQARNTTTNRLLQYEGKSLCVEEWACVLGINPRTIMSRISLGWSVEKTLGTPVRPTKPRKK